MRKESGITESWKSIANSLQRSSSGDLVAVIRDLYELNEQNRRFLSARFISGFDLRHYKEIIRRGVYPDALSNQEFNLRSARTAISNFTKATNDKVGTLELMVYYVEQGNECTLDYGDIDERFYSSLESMFAAVLKNLKKSSPQVADRFLPRLRAVVSKADGIGWGYYDYISSAVEDAFPEA